MKHTQEIRKPARWRVLLAFALVPGLTALALAIAEPGYDGLDSYAERVWRTAYTYSFAAYPLGLIIGLPVYALLRDRVKPTLLHCSLAGSFVAALPWTILMLLGPAADQASIAGRPTVINGARTNYGLLIELKFIAIIALCGSLAGFLFWFIAVVRWKGR